jgi:hypothetical protein
MLLYPSSSSSVPRSSFLALLPSLLLFGPLLGLGPLSILLPFRLSHSPFPISHPANILLPPILFSRTGTTERMLTPLARASVAPRSHGTAPAAPTFAASRKPSSVSLSRPRTPPSRCLYHFCISVLSSSPIGAKVMEMCLADPAPMAPAFVGSIENTYSDYEVRCLWVVRGST